MRIDRNDPRLIDPDKDKTIPIMVTPQFKGYFERQDERMQSQIFTRIMDTIDELRLKGPGDRRLWNVLRGIDYFIENTPKEPTCAKDMWEKRPCKKGCAHCCFMNVTCTDEEAELIFKAANKKGLVLDVELMKVQANTDIESYWKMPKEKSRCVLLQPDNTCGLYAERPTSCRTYMVASPVELCSSHSEKVLSLIPMKAEILATAYMSLRYHETWRTWETINLPARLLRLISNNQIEEVKTDNDGNL